MTPPAPFGHYSPAMVTPDAKVNLYLTDIADWKPADTIFGEVFGEHRPARAVLQVGGLHHGFRVAADAVAWRQ